MVPPEAIRTTIAKAPPVPPSVHLSKDVCERLQWRRAPDNHGVDRHTAEDEHERIERILIAGALQNLDVAHWGKHFITTITDDSFLIKRDLEKIADEEELGGLYIARSNVESELFDAEQSGRAYKDLAEAERASRSIKTVNLKCD